MDRDYFPGEKPSLVERLHKINRKLVTFCAVALLFLGSLYYFVVIAFHNSDTLQERQSPSRAAIAEFEKL